MPFYHRNEEMEYILRLVSLEARAYIIDLFLVSTISSYELLTKNVHGWVHRACFLLHTLFNIQSYFWITGPWRRKHLESGWTKSKYVAMK